MAMRVGFAEADITPPVGTHKIGWIVDIVSEQVLDPLYARAAVIESGGETIGFVQLDLLCILAEDVAEIRRRIAEAFGVGGERVMVSATHNHAGPAVASLGDATRDEPYVRALIDNCVRVFGRAMENLREARIGFGRCCEFGVSHNRRVIMRDGTVRTHGSFADPDALCLEGPIDPEVAVTAARDDGGRLLGAIVNFACHPTHHGPGGLLSAGYPGALAGEMKRRGVPVTLFLNGASGNLSTSDPATGGTDHSMEEVAGILAEDVGGVLKDMEMRDSVRLGAKSRTLDLPFREATDDQVRGTARGAQRFVDPASYDRHMPALLRYIRERGTEPAEVQVLDLAEYAYVAVPAEYFVQHGLRIKEQAYPRRPLVVSCANGILGYVPHAEAFRRGGYETTFCAWSKLAPGAGDLLADAAIEMLRA